MGFKIYELLEESTSKIVKAWVTSFELGIDGPNFREVSAYLAEFVASAPLTPLLKPDNGIRPIAVGTIWRRLVSKVAMKGVGKEMSKYLGDFQFGVGVQQGDPLRPLLFALVLHPLIHKIRDRDSCKLLLHAWYLDDGTVIGDSEEVSRVLDIITVSGPGLGLELNIKKTKIFWPSCNGTKLREGLFHVNIQRPSLSVKLLRGAVSSDADFISGLAMRRARLC
ncbi:putative reverse transcriptase domain-containing protein [Tanacetum coccineum]